MYPGSVNKGADQLRSYCEADLRLCFRLCRLLVFPWGGSFVYRENMSMKYIPLISHFYMVKLGLTVRTEGPGIDAIKFKVPT